MHEEKHTEGGETYYAVNKTAGKAFRRTGDEEWQPVDPKSVNIAAGAERAGHQKLENNWFSIYKVTTGK
jgi:hypothetical protein